MCVCVQFFLTITELVYTRMETLTPSSNGSSVMASRGREERALSNVMLEDIPRIQPHELTYVGGEVERGSFGDVRKAKWGGVDVAVKLFLIADKKGGISEEVCTYTY